MKIKVILAAFVLVISLSACSLQASAPAVDPLPTYTLYPTYTPFPTEPAPVYEFVLVWGTNQTGFEGSDPLDLACQDELGADSRLADWVDLALYTHDGGSLVALGASLGLERDAFVWISLASQMDYSDSDFYAGMYAPTFEVYFDGLDALPDWSEPAFVVTHRSGDPMLPWLPALCIREEQPNKQP